MAVDYANGRDVKPPSSLRLYFFCGEHHLPSAGGIMEQEFALMKEMRYIGFVYRTIRKMRSLVGDAINTDLSMDERMLLGNLVEMGIRI